MQKNRIDTNESLMPVAQAFSFRLLIAFFVLLNGHAAFCGTAELALEKALLAGDPKATQAALSQSVDFDYNDSQGTNFFWMALNSSRYDRNESTPPGVFNERQKFVTEMLMAADPEAPFRPMFGTEIPTLHYLFSDLEFFLVAGDRTGVKPMRERIQWLLTQLGPDSKGLLTRMYIWGPGQQMSIPAYYSQALYASRFDGDTRFEWINRATDGQLAKRYSLVNLEGKVTLRSPLGHFLNSLPISNWSKANHREAIRFVEYLLGNGADPEEPVTFERRTSFYMGVLFELDKTWKLMEEDGASIPRDSLANRAETLKEIWQMLLAKGLSPNASHLIFTPQGHVIGYTSPIAAAASKGSPQMLKFLLENGASPDWFDQDGVTALMRASRMGHQEAVRVLLRAGASPFTRSFDGQRSAIHYAIHGVTQQISPYAPKGSTPLDEVKGIVQTLVEAGESPYEDASLLKNLEGLSQSEVMEPGARKKYGELLQYWMSTELRALHGLHASTASPRMPSVPKGFLPTTLKPSRCLKFLKGN